MISTMIDNLKIIANQILSEGITLLKDYSNLSERERIVGEFFMMYNDGDYSWDELPSEGKKIQMKLLPKIDRFIELTCTITQDLPSEIQKDLIKSLKEIRNTIDQDKNTWWKNIDEAIENYKELMNKTLLILDEYFSLSSEEIIAIPDTNALIENPDIEKWVFNNVGHFTIILFPIILSELDSHKVNHKNENVRDKALKLINKFKEYRRRGSLLNGVTIVKNKISLKAISIEPNMKKSLPTFDQTNADDRFLASVLEIVRNNPNAKVFIVSSDINMQTKAEMIGLPYLEVPV